MTQPPIQIATIAELLSGGSRTHVENLSEGGAYLRRVPFRLDIGALDAAHRQDVEAYFANKAAKFDPFRHLALRGLTTPAGIRYSEIFGVLQNREGDSGRNPFTVSVDSLRASWKRAGLTSR